jgi:hypothetical protein
MPEDAGFDQTGSAVEVLTGPDEWLIAPSRTSVRRVRNAIPGFITYDASKNEFCLSRLAQDLMKDNPGLVNYRVEVRVGGNQTFLDQIALLHFETPMMCAPFIKPLLKNTCRSAPCENVFLIECHFPIVPVEPSPFIRSWQQWQDIFAR